MRIGWLTRIGLSGLVAATALGGGGMLALGDAPAARVPTPALIADASSMVAPVSSAALGAALPDVLVVKRILDIDGPIGFGEYYWDAAGIPESGPLVITVDLEAQTLSVFRDGYEIGATAILYGADDKPTPLGVYPITQKKVHHISNLYGAPMPYMMRLTNDGVALHASEVEANAATHGCIGMPLPFAKLLFAQARLGDRVIITRGKRLGVGGVIAPG